MQRPGHRTPARANSQVRYKVKRGRAHHRSAQTRHTRARRARHTNQSRPTGSHRRGLQTEGCRAPEPLRREGSAVPTRAEAGSRAKPAAAPEGAARADSRRRVRAPNLRTSSPDHPARAPLLLLAPPRAPAPRRARAAAPSHQPGRGRWPVPMSRGASEENNKTRPTRARARHAAGRTRAAPCNPVFAARHTLRQQRPRAPGHGPARVSGERARAQTTGAPGSAAAARVSSVARAPWPAPMRIRQPHSTQRPIHRPDTHTHSRTHSRTGPRRLPCCSSRRGGRAARQQGPEAGGPLPPRWPAERPPGRSI